MSFALTYPLNPKPMRRIAAFLLLTSVIQGVQAQAQVSDVAVDVRVKEPNEEEAIETPATLTATRTSEAEAPRIDGVLDEAVWASAPAITAFTQRDPIEGAAPSEATDVRVLYDDAALYIGARLSDRRPDSIMARLGRRDAELESDLFGFFIDPYFDRRSGYYFGVNAGGTLYDGVLYNDSWDDDAWDGVWQGKAQIDEEGWTVEMRIPYSQLRFQRESRSHLGHQLLAATSPGGTSRSTSSTHRGRRAASSRASSRSSASKPSRRRAGSSSCRT